LTQSGHQGGVEPTFNHALAAPTRIVIGTGKRGPELLMPALLPIFLTASHIVLAADSVPKFDVERTCQPATAAASLPGRASAACQRGEQDARSILQKDWTQYSATDQTRCTGLVTKGGAPSYVELLTCLETAKQARDVREKHRDCWPPLIVSASRTQKSEMHRQQHAP